MRDSIIRRGNHFIRIPELGWTLIDGPWLKWLKQLSGGDGGYVPIFIPLYQSPPITAYEIWDAPEYAKLEVVTWEPVHWHPGVLGPLRLAPHRYLYSDYLKRRTRLGFRLIGGKVEAVNGRAEREWETGSLPAHPCCPFPLPWYEQDMLMERGM